MRVTAANQAPVRADGIFVLYWMIAARRTDWNHGLDRAIEWCRELGKPLVVLEALRCDYPWASERFHRFILQGMVDNARSLARVSATYYPYVEPAVGKGRGLVEALGRHAAVVVTDEFPAFFLPGMVRAAARLLPVRLEQVDSNGLLPLRAADRAFETAHAFRRHLQKTLVPHLDELPAERPFGGIRLPAPIPLPGEIARRWPATPLPASDREMKALLAPLPIDRAVGAVETRGGTTAARAALDLFLDQRLDGYADRRNQPEVEATSGLSPYLHFGHLSAHEIFARLMDREDWSPARLAGNARGSRSGWWGVGAAAESFLDEFVTWREVGLQTCAHREDYDRYESLPPWALRTLAEHASDPRPTVYSLEQFARAATHDPLWNAAQTQLVREGRMHNYLRMLWGKKILEWSESPRDALAVMIELNNRYALDGRDPNSYSGIFWVLGRYDRAWGPERPIFGKVRYMSSDNTARKVPVRGFLRKYGPERIAPREGAF